MIRFILAQVLLLSFLNAPCQQHLTSITLPGNGKGIRGMMIDDDLFLSIEWQSGDQSRLSRSYIIHPDGAKVEIDLNSIAKKIMIGGLRRDNNIQFYYLDDVGSKVYIKCLQIEPSGKKEELPSMVDVPGKIYGTYIEDGSLFVLCALRKEFTLRLLQVRDGKLISETNFPLSFDLGKRKEVNVSFYHAEPPVTPKEASAPIKLMKDKNIIWITIDEPILDIDLTLTESSIFKTTAIKLDLLTGKTTIKAFFETQRYQFTSTIVNGDLYRLVLAHPVPRIDQFNFESGKKVKTANLVRGNDPARDSTYAHIGSNLKTEKDIKKANVVKRIMGSLLIVDSLSETKKMLTIGHYGDQLVLNFPTVVGLVVTLASVIVTDALEWPYSCVYYYYIGSMDTGFTATYRTPFLRQIVDEYEYNLMVNKVRFDYKGYLYHGNTTYGLYQKKKSDTMEIVKFEK